MRLAAGHFRMRTSSSTLDARVLLAAEAWKARRASHDLSRCLRTGRLHELSAGAPAHLRRDGPTVIAMSCVWSNLAATVPERAHHRSSHLGPYGGARRAARSVVGIEARRVSAGRGATRGRSGNVEGERFNWTPRERFPMTSTVGPDLGERRVAQRFPGFC